MKGENQSLPTPSHCTSAETSSFTAAQQINHVLVDFSKVKPISSSHVKYLFSFSSWWFACQQDRENQSKTYWSQRASENTRSYVTGDLPGCPGSLERDGIQPEVVAASPSLLPRVSVDFLDKENKEGSEQEALPVCHVVGSQQGSF